MPPRVTWRGWSKPVFPLRSPSRPATRRPARARSNARVVRVVTPGTLSDEALLDDRVDNLLLAVSQQHHNFGIAYLDLSTGRFRVLEVSGEEALASELQRLDPAETLYHEHIFLPAITGRNGARSQPGWEFDVDSARRALNSQFQTHDLKGFGCDNLPLAIGAAGCLLQYVRGYPAATCPIFAVSAMRAGPRASSWTRPPGATWKSTSIAGGDSNTLFSVMDRR